MNLCKPYIFICTYLYVCMCERAYTNDENGVEIFKVDTLFIYFTIDSRDAQLFDDVTILLTRYLINYFCALL